MDFLSGMWEKAKQTATDLKNKMIPPNTQNPYTNGYPYGESGPNGTGFGGRRSRKGKRRNKNKKSKKYKRFF